MDRASEFAAEVLARIRRVVGPADSQATDRSQHPVPLHEPWFGGNEWRYVKECLDTGWVSSVGQFVDRFERDLCAYTGAGHAVAVVNGTAALHIALMLAGVEPGDEVLMPSLTFVATANAVVYCGATPHFADVCEHTLGLSARSLDAYLKDVALVQDGGCRNRLTGRRIRAMVPMHAFGHPVDIEPLCEIGARYGIAVVEDAAEALGSLHRGRHTGTFGLVAALSFNGNKIVTTGGGGAVLTNDAGLAKRAKHVTTTAKLPHRWRFEHDMVGYNYRMPNLNAALGCAQLEHMEVYVASKRRLYGQYAAALDGLSGGRLVSEPSGSRSNYWLQTLLLDNDYADALERVLEVTNGDGVMTRPAWTPMHTLAHFSEVPRMPLPVTESLARRILNLPSGPRLTLDGANG